MAGIPAPVLLAYRNYHEELLIYNSFGGNLGQGHTHRCGIPQGCPLSMVFVSLLLRAWITQMIAHDMQPRTLADDFLLTTKLDTSPQHALSRFSTNLCRTMEHIQDIGGRIAPSKSKVFATMASHREWLKTFVWIPLGTTIEVTLQMRDLGSHLVAG
eukprot:3952066-Karenia_brevis.AAC.1